MYNPQAEWCVTLDRWARRWNQYVQCLLDW